MNDTERPVYASFTEPEPAAGSIVVEVRAAALTGVDIAIARRRHYIKMPDGPFVLGKDGVAQRGDGPARLLYRHGAGRTVRLDGRAHADRPAL